MGLLKAEPAPGDWIVVVKPLKVTLTDHLLSGDAGIRAGTRGVVTARHGWNRLEGRFDAGLAGTVTTRFAPRDVRVVRRGGGVSAFRARSERMVALRVGVALALLAPSVWVGVRWYASGGSEAGLISGVVEGMLQGLLEMFDYASTHPLGAALYLLVVGTAMRFAFGDRFL